MKRWKVTRQIVLIAIAACLVVCLVLFSMMTPMSKRGVDEDASWAITSSFTSYSADGDRDEKYHEKRDRTIFMRGSSVSSDGSRMVQLKTDLPKEIIEGTPRPVVLPARTPGSRKPVVKTLALNRRAADEKQGILTNEKRSGDIGGLSKRKPSIPSSSIAKVIASNTTTRASGPMPKINAPDSHGDRPIRPMDLKSEGVDDYDAFGSGLGSGGGGGGRGGSGKGDDPFGGGDKLARLDKLNSELLKSRAHLESEESDEEGGIKAQSQRLDSIAGQKTPVVLGESGNLAGRDSRRSERDGKWYDEKKDGSRIVAGVAKGAGVLSFQQKKKGESKEVTLGDEMLPGNAGGYAYDQSNERWKRGSEIKGGITENSESNVAAARTSSVMASSHFPERVQCVNLSRKALFVLSRASTSTYLSVTSSDETRRPVTLPRPSRDAIAGVSEATGTRSVTEALCSPESDESST